MSMHGAGSGGAARLGIRSLRRDRSLLEHQLKKGTLPRILKFAKHYQGILVFFLVAVVLGAIVSSVAPLLLRAIIDQGIKGHHEGLIIGLSILTAVLAILDAGLSMVERRISAVIGEGLIYDLRAAVFAHIQQMPVAFFSRTQTGALISRLNNDVIGAQQAFTDLLIPRATGWSTPGHALPTRYGTQRRDEYGDERALQCRRRHVGETFWSPE
ncbi:MAG: hypothetical protein B7X07_06980 [Actinobacteria bacterium 21-64-8]|nr:MAG: hypothetical protein B7X07_06980 [Actinobacteria bacterium 21-64-8]